MRRTVRLAAGVAAAVALTAFAISCDDSNGPNPPTYTANLVGAAEVPSTTSTGTGTATFVDNGTSIEYTLSVTGLTAITFAHIHAPATTTQTANPIINLFIPNGPTGAVDGVIATGTITNANNQSFTVDALRAFFIAGTAYVNVHTTPLPNGAIRGQVARSN
jgi:CHRD domain-containing protein